MNQLKLSIVMTTLNNANYLKKSLMSIEKQDYPFIEVCIKDGMSTDGTVDLIQKYEQKSHFEVKWVSEQDSGIYDAMNKGYALATGDVIVFFNDFFIKKNAVSKMMTLLSDKSNNTVGAHADLIYARGNKIIRFWKMGNQKPLYWGWMPGHPTLFLKREIYTEYGQYDTSFKIAADYEFMIRFLKYSKNKLVYLPEPIVKMYYGGTSNQSARSYILSLKEGHRALKKNNIRFACFIDTLRTIRVGLQFIQGGFLKYAYDSSEKNMHYAYR